MSIEGDRLHRLTWRSLWIVQMLVLVAVLAPPRAVAEDRFAECFEAAARRYAIAPALLRAITTAESAMDPWALGQNAGSYDIGLMQVNSRWLDQLARHGIAERDLWDPCINVQVGAWVLAGNIARYGHTWEAVGAYNAGTATTAGAHRRRMAYAHRIAAHLGAERGAPGRLRGPAGAPERTRDD